ncbi:taurine catabolism dioxygenase, TauD/TfdA domain protein [Leptospira weilii str. Ecochallenge]|uniref:Taurine catabolism dioxygenase, TauD/TfdA domain protein n=1 Tax=Leptospira weilii str. Ecochallenge TaxID=1049986 RepID=N1U3I9_9LEPT|nr:taurine catabolism dioxygenase, TauD/TfdA domain protein [Leptospira weilii str. Ecochallenge]
MAAKTFSKVKSKTHSKAKTKAVSVKKAKPKVAFALSKGFIDFKNPLPVVYQPDSEEQKGKQNLIQWIKSNKRALTDDLKEYGAVLFRGFDVSSPQDFEDVIINVDSNLKNNYLGTSPRNQVTQYAFTATELPPAYPIMQHAEMSFLDSPPKKLFFYCKKAPETFGETPITDLRKVLNEVPDFIREKFEKKKFVIPEFMTVLRIDPVFNFGEQNVGTRCFKRKIEKRWKRFLKNKTLRWNGSARIV